MKKNLTGFLMFYRISARDRSGLKNAFFTGCIKNLVINEQSINLATTNGDTLDQRGLAPCPSCVGKPCGDHGTCVSGVNDKFTCTCDENYSGKLCEIARGKHLLIAGSYSLAK